MVAPFIPAIKDGPVDVSNISQEFTQMSLDQTPEEASRLSQMLAEEIQFSNFTYVHEDMNQAMQ